MTVPFEAHAEAIRDHAARSLFEHFESSCEGAIAVDADARIVWMNDKYATFLGLGSVEDALGRVVEDVIPNSLLREVLRSGRPMLLDIMQFNDRPYVVTRIPLRGPGGEIAGAVGFVLYDNIQALGPLVAKFTRLGAELAGARRELAEQRGARYTFAHYVGSSPPCVEVKRQARRAAQLDSAVLLLGETGTGKELLAQAIHSASARARGPFIGVNVAAIPDSLLEAEFFGVAPGAYTGADRKGRPGKFKLADGGTLFLDEVGDMPLHLQPKLLRALQEQEVEPLGSNRVERVNVRVVAATSRDLRRMVDEGSFRSDLYYRLNVLPITLPALRDRPADLAALCDTIFGQIAARSGEPLRELSPGALSALAAYPWPGNVRELQNVLERAAMLSHSSELTTRDFEWLLPALPPSARSAEADAAPRLQEVLHAAERSALRDALHQARGNRTAAATRLGISRATLYEKLARHDLLSEKPDTV